MAIGEAGVLAPQGLIIPSPSVVQVISGAIWISGASLCFYTTDGTDTVVALT